MAYPNQDPKHSDAGASKMRRLPHVMAYLEALIEQCKEEAGSEVIEMDVMGSDVAKEQAVFAGWAEKRKFNRDVLMTPATSLLEDGDIGMRPRPETAHLIQEYTVTESFNSDGDLTRVRHTVKLPDKLRAMAIDNQMAGHDGPIGGEGDGNIPLLERLASAIKEPQGLPERDKTKTL